MSPPLGRNATSLERQAAQLGGIVRIEMTGARGTGFIVRVERATEDDEAAVVELLTALHVVADLSASRTERSPQWRPGHATLTIKGGGSARVDPETANVHADIDDDWVLLRVLVEKLPRAVRAFRLAQLEERARPRHWSTFGYSSAQPIHGEPHHGDVQLVNPGKIHLFGKNAAAGSGGNVAGCSGGPCIVEGHVVGILQEALQNDQRESVHGAIYALPIGVVAGKYKLPLAEPKTFDHEVSAALQGVTGLELVALAAALDVPHTESEEGLRIWIARALLAAGPKALRDALLPCHKSVRDVMALVSMGLTNELLEANVRAVKRLLEDSPQNGVAILATEKLVAELLTLRALGQFAALKSRYEFVEARSRTSEDWASRVRQHVLKLLAMDEDDDIDDSNLLDALRDGPRALLGFRFDEKSSEVPREVARYHPARGLALTASTNDAAHLQQQNYDLAPHPHDHTEHTIRTHWAQAKRHFRT